LSKFAEQNDVDVHNWWFVFISTATAIFVAYFFYELVEVRLCNMVRKALKRTGTPKRVPLNGAVEA
jgi:peptidoglycan/LPS O-acetylase OafA/YrhL